MILNPDQALYLVLGDCIHSDSPQLLRLLGLVECLVIYPSLPLED